MFQFFQGVLTAIDTYNTTSWRDEDSSWFNEDRRWRSEDLRWRKAELTNKVSSAQHNEGTERWREEDMMQRHVENSRILWLRFVEKNRRDVEEKTTNLKAVSGIAAIFAGFSVVSLTQLKIEYPQNPLSLLAIYAVLTSVSACCMIISLVSSTLLLGSILKKGKTYVREEIEEEFIMECQKFVIDFQEGNTPPKPRRSFDSFWEMRCEPTWQLSLFCLRWGVGTFLVSLGPIGWLVFFNNNTTVILWMVTLGSVICLLFYGQYLGSFYQKNTVRDSMRMRGQSMGGLPFDWHKAPS